MTMRIVFLKDYEDKKKDVEYFLDRPEAVVLCEKGIAVPTTLYEKMQRKNAEKAEVEKKKKAAERAEADKKRKAAEALAKKEEPKKSAPRSKSRK